ncbi:MAG: carboxylesterase family protein [Myxococcales bacterium]|nr:carboxylesterase family protein [Myxococcales bacterium]
MLLRAYHLGLLLAFASAAAACAPSSESDEAPGPGALPDGPVTAELDSGTVEGWRGGGVQEFLGIPYAAAPVGALRWRAPEPPAGWTGVRNATVKGSACPQTVPLLGDVGDEDCLYLNVHTPEPRPATPAPVMVWIHGGGFTLGEGVQTDGGTKGERLALASGHVVVSFNYRLGALGFLAERHLSAEDATLPGSGNYGLEDQVAALDWVQRNIAAFGGDPTAVTIFGQSAGSMSVCTLLTMPSAQGLFARAILESGSCTTPASSLAAAEAQGDVFAQALGCDTAADVPACLRSASVDAVRTTLPPDPAFISADTGTHGSWMPIVDGRVVPAQAAAALAAGDFATVPTIVGWTRDEGTLFVALAYDMQGAPLTAAEYPQVLDALAGDAALAQAIAVAYPLADYATPGAALAAVLGDAYFACPSRTLRAALAAHAPLFAYEFDYPHPKFQLESPVDLGAFHAAEVQFVFGHPAALFVKDFEGAELELSRDLEGYWGRFAATADPNGAGAASWPAYDTAGDAHLSIDVASVASSGASAEACAFWASVDYLRPPLPEPP